MFEGERMPADREGSPPVGLRWLVVLDADEGHPECVDELVGGGRDPYGRRGRGGVRCG